MIGATRFGRMWRKMMRAVGGAQRAGGLDELLLAQREDLAADDARHVGPAGERDDEDHDRQAGLDQVAVDGTHEREDDGGQEEDDARREAQRPVAGRETAEAAGARAACAMAAADDRDAAS